MLTQFMFAERCPVSTAHCADEVTKVLQSVLDNGFGFTLTENVLGRYVCRNGGIDDEPSWTLTTSDVRDVHDRILIAQRLADAFEQESVMVVSFNGAETGLVYGTRAESVGHIGDGEWDACGCQNPL